MKTIKLGDKVKVLDSAFGDSTDPVDVAAWGKIGEVIYDLEAELGTDWAGCIVVFINGNEEHLTTDEVEVIKAGTTGTEGSEG